jgi:hypothetical protein
MVAPVSKRPIAPIAAGGSRYQFGDAETWSKRETGGIAVRSSRWSASGTRSSRRRDYELTGTAISPEPLKRIEIVKNGDVIQALEPENRPTKLGAYESSIKASVAVDESSWLIVRCFEDRPVKRFRFAQSG